MSKAIYDNIDKYTVYAQCNSPMHIGSEGDKSEILMHPNGNMPFIQATGICGVLRSYCEKISDIKTVSDFFGDAEDGSHSKVKISDGKFKLDEHLKLELRPRIKINSETGTMAASKVKGTIETVSGQKFDMEYISAGAEFSFDIYLYSVSEKERNLILMAIAALNEKQILLGGQKSNGCGEINICKILHKYYDMHDKNDRKLWIEETGMEEMKIPALNSGKNHINAYEIEIDASTENELLVKGIAVDSFGEKAPKSVNMKDGKGEYIIPASSIKGAVRNRMEMIAKSMNLEDSIISESFGKTSDGSEKGNLGSLRFKDIYVGKESRRKEKLSNRIHIDKFTGGVMNGGLFSELNIYGSMKIRITVSDCSNQDSVLGLLIFAIRDLKYKMYALGSGQSIGKGYIDIHNIIIKDLNHETKCEFDEEFHITDETGIIDRCMKSLKERQMK